MMSTVVERVRQALVDVRHNRARRLRHGVRWRVRRVRAWVLPSDTRGDRGDRSYTCGSGRNGDRLWTALTSGDATGLGYMTGGATRRDERLIHVDVRDLARFLELVRREGSELELMFQAGDQRPAPLTEQSAQRLAVRAESFDILVVERVHRFEVAMLTDRDVENSRLPTAATARRHIQTTRIGIATWRQSAGPHGIRVRETDRELPLVARLRQTTFERLTREHHDFDDDLPGTAYPTFDIDIVYTWVDGDDERWAADKEQYARAAGASVPDRAVHVERFRNRDELKYSLRSIEMFAPWVRRIHIVTADQCPPWLNVDHPKINLVSHRDIYRDPSWLPTFNSSSIETQLHHVPGLARHFIYFNDDVLLGQLCCPSDFFEANGVVKYFPSTQRAYEGDIDEDSEEYVQADKNAIELLASRFPAVGREIMMHVPHPADRDLLDELEANFPDAFAECAAARFRSSRDLRPIAFMQYHYGFQRRMAERARISHRYLALWKPTICGQLANVERRRSYKTLCLNDVGLERERTAMVNEAVGRFLEAYYPLPSAFELADAACRAT